MTVHILAELRARRALEQHKATYHDEHVLRLKQQIQQLKRAADEGRVNTFAWGFLFQKEGFWVGAHYSREYKRLCVNLLPCCTVWVTWPNGKPPARTRK